MLLDYLWEAFDQLGLIHDINAQHYIKLCCWVKRSSTSTMESSTSTSTSTSF
jgi:hypothetical protein